MDMMFVPGEWYLTVFCSGCKKRIPVFHEHSEASSDLAVGYDVTCPHCHHSGSYDRDKVQHYRHPDELPFNLEPPQPE
jgi:DNA-directed RNA polymerase subunit RPC12/RpoP